MKINNISNTQFKGAYFITGKGKDVKQAEIAIEKGLNGKEGIHTLGHGYTTDDNPAYLLITTGKDAEEYNKFAAREQQKCYEELLKTKPKEKPEEKFESKRAFLTYRISRAGVYSIENILINCKFKDAEPSVRKANDVLKAIDKNEFNYTTGELE